MASIRTLLDSDQPFTEDIDFNSMCEILIEFLKSLTQPVIPLDHLDLYCVMFV
jgi:hypothetical protein